MLKFMVLLKRKPGMSKEAFREHYETSHVKLALKFFGHLWIDYQRHYPEAASAFADGEGGASIATVEDVGCMYDAISFGVLRDQAAMDEMIRIHATPEVKHELDEDEKRFLDRPACRLMMVDTVTSEVSRS